MLSSRTKLLLIFAALAVATFASALVFYLAGVRVALATTQLSDCYETALDLKDILSALQEAETRQRGFLLTGDETYVEFYDAAVGRINSDLDRLAHSRDALVAPALDISTVNALAHEKLDELQLTMELRRGGTWRQALNGARSDVGQRIVTRLGTLAKTQPQSGLEAAMAVMRLDVGKQLMNELRSRISDLENSERQATEFWQAKLNEAAVTRTVLSITLAALDLAFLGWALRRIDRLLTAAEQSAADARNANESLRKMEVELSLSEENERRRLAGDLHDGVSQLLTAVQMRLPMIESRSSPEERNRLLAQVEQLIGRAELCARSLTSQLSPPALYELGFVAAADWLAEDMNKVFGLKVALHDDGNPKPLDMRTRIVLFQCLRELMANVAKHAGTDHALVRICARRRTLRVTVADHGVGFETAAAMLPRALGGYGLFSVKERMRHVGGRMLIRSSPGSGTVVLLNVPMDSEPPWPAGKAI